MRVFKSKPFLIPFTLYMAAAFLGDVADDGAITPFLLVIHMFIAAVLAIPVVLGVAIIQGIRGNTDE